jgi:hypothetical protein
MSTKLYCGLVLAGLALAGCKKVSCPEGAYKHDNPGFCLKLPADIKPRDPNPPDSLGWTRLDMDGVGVVIEWTSSEDNYKTIMKGTENEGTKTDGGERLGGKWRAYTDGNRVGLSSIVRSGQYTISCRGFYYKDSETRPEYLEACKSLLPL